MNEKIILALHIIFIVTWFAGLFYIVRLFVYQIEAREKPENERAVLEPQFKMMAKRLWYGITWPSFILTLIFGPWLLVLKPIYLELGFMHIKLTLVGGLIIYHFICHSMFLKLQNDKGNLLILVLFRYARCNSPTCSKRRFRFDRAHPA